MKKEKETKTAMKKVIALTVIFMFFSIYFSYNTTADPQAGGTCRNGKTCLAGETPATNPDNTVGCRAADPTGPCNPTATCCVGKPTITCENTGGMSVPKEKCAPNALQDSIVKVSGIDKEVILANGAPSNYVCCLELNPEAVKEFNSEKVPSWSSFIGPTVVNQLISQAGKKAAGAAPLGGAVSSIAQPKIPLATKGQLEATIEHAFNVISLGLAVIRTGMILIGGGDKNYGTCKAEKPIMGIDKETQENACKSCNGDPLRLCTEERCKILGNCIPIAPKETEEQANYVCVPGKCDETGLVNMKLINATFYAGGVVLLTDEKATNHLDVGQVAWNADSVKVKINTDILAQCRYSFEAQSEFASMTDFEDNYFPGTYNSPDYQEVIIPLPGDMARGEQHTIYIKCNNVCGKAHEKADDNRYVRFNFGAKPDQLPPVIIATDPVNYGAVSGELTTLVTGFQLDEEGYCKYSDNWTKKDNVPVPLTTKWEDMIDFRTSVQSPGSAVVKASCGKIKCEQLRNQDCTYCNLTLDMSKGFTNISWDKLPLDIQKDLDMTEVSKFFHFEIRCADKGENKMAEEDTLDYNFFTVPGYTIKLERPEQGEAIYDPHPEIFVTSTRNTECRYQITKAITCPGAVDWAKMVAIDDVFGKEHTGIIQESLEPTVEGMTYCLNIKCRDAWALDRTAFTTFKLYRDIKAPFVARVYHDTIAGDYLLFETNEDASCKYNVDDEKGCNFDYNEGTDMTGVNETMHTSYWTLEHLFYIKCVDIWGNYPGNSPTANRCTAIINPFEVPEIPR